MYCETAVLSIDRPVPTIIPKPIGFRPLIEERPEMKLLHIDSSPLGGSSVSRELTQRIVTQWRATHPHTKVEHLDLAMEAPGHLNADSLGFRLGVGAQGLSDVQRKKNKLSEKLVSQFHAADVVVVGAPMYNFSVPSQLKAWIDRVARAGRAGKYTDKGPQGLVGGKTVIIASSAAWAGFVEYLPPRVDAM